MLFLLTGCAAQPATTTSTETIKMAGSGTIANVAKDLAKAYMAKNKDINIIVEQTNSNEGIKAAAEVSVEIGMTSRRLNEEEKKTGLMEHVIAYDALAVIVNNNNPVSELSLEQLKGIYTGAIKNWKEVGGNDAPIIAATRPEGFGARSVLDDVAKIEKETESAQVIDNNNDVLPFVVPNENAIAYISMSYVDGSVKALKVGGALPTVFAVKSKEYALSRNLLLVTKEEVKPAVDDFLDFIKREEGQKIVANKDYITIRKSRK